MLRMGVLLIWIINCSSSPLWAEPLTYDVQNKARLQRGAQLFMNYCSGCHSLKYLRYSHMAEGLGLIGFDGRIDEQLLKNNLIFTQAAINDPIRIALPPEDAKQWFGVIPPDLSLVAREKGASWLFNYLKSFYNDNSRPFGVNNLIVPGVAMPNILESLIGEMRLVQGDEKQTARLLLVKEGELSPAEANLFLQDLVTFLVYVGEPTQVIRAQLGWFVLLFLIFFLLVAMALKRVYWQKISAS